MDICNLTLTELRQMRESINSRITTLEKQERENAINEIYRIAHNLNMPLADLLNKKPAKVPVTALYQDPSNPENKWAGRGPRPRWLKEAIANGANLDDFKARA